MKLAETIIAYMRVHGMRVDAADGEINIVYIEGMDPDGTLNFDLPNEWNDLRIIIGFRGGVPSILGNWIATTEPGRFYTEHPLNAEGAARLTLGQQIAWKVGIHHAGKPGAHEALVQAAPVSVCRDLDENFRRGGDLVETGWFGINQHAGYGTKLVDKNSAGCMTTQNGEDHRDSLVIVKGSAQYKNNPDFVYPTTLILGQEIVGSLFAPNPFAG